MKEVTQSILDWFKEAKPEPTAKDVAVQIGCHFEEVSEMCEALYINETDIVLQDEANWFKSRKATNTTVQMVQDFNKQELLDSLCDQVVTAIGVGYMMGFDIIGALNEVNNSNWSKFENGKAIFDENGKIKKGVNYFKPDLTKFIKE